MKALLISLSFLVLYISSLNAEPVFDVDGDDLKAGERYYIISAIWGAGGGGVSLTTAGNPTCNDTVYQLPSSLDYGQPVEFSPAHPSEDGTINLSSSLNIKFYDTIACARSSVWQVGSFSPLIGSMLIEINGVEGNPSCDTFRNWFKIERLASRIYKLVNDPSDVCGIPIQKYDVGKFSAMGKTFLGIGGDNTFPVVFLKESSVGGGIKLPK